MALSPNKDYSPTTHDFISNRENATRAHQLDHEFTTIISQFPTPKDCVTITNIIEFLKTRNINATKSEITQLFSKSTTINRYYNLLGVNTKATLPNMKILSLIKLKNMITLLTNIIIE